MSYRTFYIQIVLLNTIHQDSPEAECNDPDSDCSCPGEISFSSPWSDGGVLEDCPMFADPLTKKDLSPRLRVEGKGWDQDTPNILRLKPEVTARGVRVEGEVSRQTYTSPLTFPFSC